MTSFAEYGKESKFFGIHKLPNIYIKKLLISICFLYLFLMPSGGKGGFMRLVQMMLVVLIIGAAAKATAENQLPNTKVKCSVEVISDICGSGQVSIEISQGNFVLKNGDVRCWFGDFTLLGKVVRPRADHSGSAVTVDLMTSQGHDNEEDLVGHLTYRRGQDGKAPIATLETKEQRSKGGKAAVYHMQCEEEPPRGSCMQSCCAEGKAFQECHLRCDEW